MKKQLTYISLFSSAGIGCYGFKSNKFECIATNELLTKRLKIQTYNNKCRYKEGYLDGDITQKETQNKLFNQINFWKEKHKIEEPDVIIATPPCQGMSVANHKKKDEKNRNSLVVESIQITKKVLPKFFVFENVRAFLTTICTDIDGIDKSIDDAIKFALGGNYNILTRVVNFKECGSNSSRTRTLVIGVRKDLQNITPFDIFPKNKKAKTLRELIGDLPSLTEMGEISEDIFHSYRTFDKRMLPWIENLKEGQSAFDNTDSLRIPHRIIEGVRVLNQSKNGDKYARWYWDREGPCVHTRNDILSSQNTVHPKDNRVFSIRELMRMMSIPKTFEWSNIKTNELNKLTFLEKKVFIKKEELNIRHCLGEAVPTGVFSSIALNIKTVLENNALTVVQVKGFVDKYELNKHENLINFINHNLDNCSLDNLFLIAGLSNSQSQESVYFTRKDIGYSVVKDLPILKKKKKIKILEPSVGVGNFLPLLFEKYKDKTQVLLDVYDSDSNSIQILKTLLNKIKTPSNFIINLINEDFLLSSIKNKYDIVVGNPLVTRFIKNKELLNKYKLTNTDINSFLLFIEKSLKLGNYVSLVMPKSLFNFPEFDKTRDLLSSYSIDKICDYEEKGFSGLGIFSFLINTNAKIKSNNIIIESYTDNTYSSKEIKDAFHKLFQPDLD